MRKRVLIFIISSIACLILYSCNYVATTLPKSDLAMSEIIEQPVKVFLHNGSSITYLEGARVSGNFIFGKGTLYSLENPVGTDYYKEVPVDSIAAINVYEDYGRTLSILGGITLATSPFFAVVVGCAVCPKCCFGSCPTVYTYRNGQKVLEAELFSSSISKFMKKNDTDILEGKGDESGKLDLLLTNEAMETHYIDKLRFIVVEHPENTRIVAGIEKIYCIGNTIAPAKAVNSDVQDITRLIDESDSLDYRSGREMVREMPKGKYKDHIDITFNSSGKKGKSKLVLNYRNTLMSTILLYDVVMASQGTGAVKWLEKMNSDSSYACLFNKVYQAFSGIKVFTKRGGNWEYLATIDDAGPLNYKEACVVLPETREETEDVRLEFTTDNFMINSARLDIEGSENELSAREIFPEKFESNTMIDSAGFTRLIRETDNEYLVNEPGDYYTLSFRMPKENGRESTLMILSNGYYTEWVRGNWLSGIRDYRFNLADIKGVIGELSRSWLENRDLIESKFFDTKISLRGRP